MIEGHGAVAPAVAVNVAVAHGLVLLVLDPDPVYPVGKVQSVINIIMVDIIGFPLVPGVDGKIVILLWGRCLQGIEGVHLGGSLDKGARAGIDLRIDIPVIVHHGQVGDAVPLETGYGGLLAVYGNVNVPVGSAIVILIKLHHATPGYLSVDDGDVVGKGRVPVVAGHGLDGAHHVPCHVHEIEVSVGLELDMGCPMILPLETEVPGGKLGEIASRFIDPLGGFGYGNPFIQSSLGDRYDGERYRYEHRTEQNGR